MPSCSKPRVVGSSVSKSRFSHRDVGAGERVQERRLADVRVAGERDGRRLGCARAPCGASRAACSSVVEPALEQRRSGGARAGGRSRAATRPGPARADAAAEALEVLPHAAHARQVVLELRELDLELALGADARAGRRCRGSAASGRRRARRARPRASAAAPGRARRRRAGVSASASRVALASAPRACPCRRTCAGRARRAAGRPRPTGSTPAVRASSRELGRAPRRRRRPAAAPRATNPRSGSAPGAGSGWRVVTRRTRGLCHACRHATPSRDLLAARRSSSSTSRPRAATRRRSPRYVAAARAARAFALAYDGETRSLRERGAGQPARPARRPPRHRSGAGQPAGPDRGRRGASGSARPT